ncbi:acetate--CoA ligase family protein [Bradyrhizobium sp. RDT46]|uniref:acetate--CoA ligase family protein n=1 Tax=Bradyrhizobium sp. RDT46 TaxID=3341829 RepID=UPI0035C7548D
MNAIERLIRPRSIAVIGASADPSKTSGRPVSYLQKHGFAGEIYPVNPKVGEIGGLKCYADVASLPDVPDVGLVLVGAERAHIAVRELSERGAAAAIVLASGFTETGAEGAARQQQLMQAAGSMRILGPNTIGLVNLTDNIVLSASGALAMDHFPAGAIGLISQSGGFSVPCCRAPRHAESGCPSWCRPATRPISRLSDFIDFLAEDDATRVIALYIEAIRNPLRFREAVLRARRAGKPVVAFKIGRSEAGAQAAVSHTGALAGSDRMYDALLTQLGVIRARTFEDLLDIPAVLAAGRKLSGRRIAILTSTGGAGTIVSDSLGVAGFTTPAPDAETAAQLRALQSGSHANLDRNPIDVTLAGLQPELLRGAIRILLASPSYDALVVIAGSSAVGSPALLADAIRDCLPLSDKPVIAYVSPYAPEVVSVLTRRGVPAYTCAESCSAALDGLLRATMPEQVQKPTSSPTTVDVSDIPAGPLDEAQAKALFARFGIPVAAEKLVATAREAEQAARSLGDRVVLKILSREIAHKSDVGGVVVNLTADVIGGRLTAMTDEVEARTGKRPDQFLVQEMISGGVEIILGMHRDSLGTAILLGMGGVAAELFKDTTMRLLPPNGGLDLAEARAMARDLVTWPLLDGFRGRPACDVEALAEAVVAFSRMVAQLGERLAEAEINPMIVLPAGQGVKAADGLVVLNV